MDRYIRAYQLNISHKNEIIVIKDLAMSFSYSKTMDSQLNRLQVRLFNLSANHRELLSRDELDEKKYIGIEFWAGYVGDIKMLFRGSLHIGTTQSNGTEFVSDLIIFDGGYDQTFSFINKTVRTNQEALIALLDTMEHTEKGKVKKLDNSGRPIVLMGKSYAKFKEITSIGDTYYIDNGRVFVLNDNQIISDRVTEVSAKTGMIGMPTRSKTEVKIKTMINLDLDVCGIFYLKSVHNESLNGVYKITGISCAGSTNGDNWTQDVTAVRAHDLEVVK